MEVIFVRKSLAAASSPTTATCTSSPTLYSAFDPFSSRASPISVLLCLTLRVTSFTLYPLASILKTWFPTIGGLYELNACGYILSSVLSSLNSYCLR